MIDKLIEDWLKLKSNVHTKSQYRSSIFSFRSFLQREAHIDLLDDTDLEQICAQIWICLSSKTNSISLSTIKSRNSIISAFYEFAIAVKATQNNPMHNIGKLLETKQIDHQHLPTDTLEEKRNAALILVAEETRKPYAQLAEIRLCDVVLQDGIYWVCWKRTKTKSNLSIKTSYILADYLSAIRYIVSGREERIWISFSNRNRNKPVSQKTVSNICTGQLSKCENSIENSQVVTLYKAGHSVLEIESILVKGQNDVSKQNENSEQQWSG